MTPRARSHIWIPLVLVAAAIAVGALATATVMPHRQSAAMPAVGGPFELTSQEGKPVTESALKGHPTLVFFGYTHCPDVCPATLSQISTLFKALGPDETARAIFITVDPQRDTPVVLADYLSSFDPRILGLTGSPEAIEKVEHEYKVYAKAVPDKDGTYTMDHTAITYLMDKNGDFVEALDLDRPTKDVAAELTRYF